MGSRRVQSFTSGASCSPIPTQGLATNRSATTNAPPIPPRRPIGRSSPSRSRASSPHATLLEDSRTPDRTRTTSSTRRWASRTRLPIRSLPATDRRRRRRPRQRRARHRPGSGGPVSAAGGTRPAGCWSTRTSSRVVSLFFDLDPDRFATTPARAGQLRSLLDDARRTSRDDTSLGHAERKAVQEDLGRLESYMESDDAPISGARALAVFVSAGCVRGHSAHPLGPRTHRDRPPAARGTARRRRAPGAVVRGARRSPPRPPVRGRGAGSQPEARRSPITSAAGTSRGARRRPTTSAASSTTPTSICAASPRSCTATGGAGRSLGSSWAGRRRTSTGSPRSCTPTCAMCSPTPAWRLTWRWPGWPRCGRQPTS